MRIVHGLESKSSSAPAIEPDLRKIVGDLDRLLPVVGSTLSAAGAGMSAAGFRWIVATLKALGWYQSTEFFGTEVHSFEKALDEICFVLPWTESHDRGLRFTRYVRTDESFLGTLGYNAQVVALPRNAARFELTNRELADEEGDSLLPVCQQFIDAVCKFTGFGVNSAGSQHIEWTGTKAHWNRAAAMCSLLAFAVPSLEVAFTRDRFVGTSSLSMIWPEGMKSFPDALLPENLLEPWVRMYCEDFSMAS